MAAACSWAWPKIVPQSVVPPAQPVPPAPTVHPPPPGVQAPQKSPWQLPAAAAAAFPAVLQPRLQVMSAAFACASRALKSAPRSDGPSGPSSCAPSTSLQALQVLPQPQPQASPQPQPPQLQPPPSPQAQPQPPSPPSPPSQPPPGGAQP